MNVALRPDAINFLSLCTGGAGLDLGFELAVPSARAICMVEREAFSAAQLVSAMEAGYLAPAPIWSDARTFNGRPWRGLVDGVIGGIPCQPHSLAGKRLERQDPRDLWTTARRIIVQSGAWFVLIENVGGMLSSGGAERVWRDLGRLGFACEIGLFTAAEVGASHLRERLFILGVADTEKLGSQEWRRQDPQRHRKAAIGIADGDTELDFTLGGRRRARRDDHRKHGGIEPCATSHVDVANAERDRRRQGEPGARVQRRQSESNQGGSSVVAVSAGQGLQGRRSAGDRPGQRSPSKRSGSLFPPRPDDLSGWRDALASAPQLEPAFRRVANGLASRMDVARVDRLRMLGNGVVPLEAGYAVRTLAARLARRGSAGAALLAGVDHGKH